MINPTWLDKERRIIYISTRYINLDNPLNYSVENDHGILVIWNETNVTVNLIGHVNHITCDRKNLFWEDGKGDYKEKYTKEKK